MNNKISDIAEVEKLGKCKNLQRLVLINNPVTEAVNYRIRVIARIPQLRILDFQKVSKSERKLAEKWVADEEAKKWNNDLKSLSKNFDQIINSFTIYIYEINIWIILN